MACRTAVRLIVLLAGLVLTSAQALADVVAPSPDVTTRVIVRASASSQSEQIGSLLPGQQLELIGSVPNWHEVRLPGGAQRFVSKRWTVVVPTTPPGPAPAAAAPTFAVDVVDVGTGLGILVRGPDFTLIYDGGSNDDLARGPGNRLLAYIRAVAPTLTTVNHLVLSHPHRDHVQLLPDLFGAYQIEQVWDSGRINDICGYRAFLTAVRDEPNVAYHNALQDLGTRDYLFGAKECYGEDLPAVTLQLQLASRITNSPIILGQDASMTILHADGGSHSSPNENSVDVRIDLGTTRVLLMGTPKPAAANLRRYRQPRARLKGSW